MTEILVSFTAHPRRAGFWEDYHLLDLVRTLLERAIDDIREWVPFVVNLSINTNTVQEI